MASVQVEEISAKAKAELEEMMKEAASAEAIDKWRSNQQAAVTMRNTSKGTMTFYTSHNWSGQVVKQYPLVMPAGSTGAFAHEGSPPNGSKAAVIYSGRNEAQQQCSWLLAWWDLQKKVLVLTGLEKDFRNINWNDIESRLNRQGNHSSYSDGNTETEASANINTTGQVVAQFIVDYE